MSCFDKACKLLAIRPHFRRELERKLAQRGHPPEEVAGAVARLEELGYLDDVSCARALATGPLARRGYGPRRMRAELERRGAAGEAVAAAFADGEEAAARRVAERWLAGRGGGREALARHLDRKGYSGGVVLQLASEIEPEAG